MKRILLLLLLTPQLLAAQHVHPANTIPAAKTVAYDLYIHDTIVNYTGKKVHAMGINGRIPGPVLYFTEGDTAVIRVHNEMMHETSLHWHGLLLPNLMDGVPYLTTPAIRSHTTYTYTIPLRQSGTYWYHSHTMLQEQSGVYGSIVIQPRQPRYKTDGDAVLLFSDWTNESPHEVMHTLRRKDEANEWYAIKKKYPQSLDKLLQHKAWGERVRYAWQKMPPMDLSDVYYHAFLLNGARSLSLAGYAPGSKIRLRVVNGSSSTYMHLQYAGGPLELIAADGVDVQPVKVGRILIGIAETYDFLLTVPATGTSELRATAQDVTGYAAAWLGRGDTIRAPDIPAPDVWRMSGMMALTAVNMPDAMQMDHGNGMDHSLMDMDMNMDTNVMDHTKMNHPPDKQPAQQDTNAMDHTKMNHAAMHHGQSDKMAMAPVNREPSSATEAPVFNYHLLKALHPTAFPTHQPVRRETLRLNGNMYRYVWRINNKTLSAADKLLIKKGEIVQFDLVNETMMNHPMHLHGHYFRVLNKQGDFSPLKHTVDVPPMSTVKIQFEASEDKDWFFHCHVLYHMMTGMARIVSYEGSVRDTALRDFPLKTMLKEDREWLFYGSLAAKSHMAELKANYLNAANAFRLEADANYSGQYEADVSYERYVNDWFRPYIGVTSLRQTYYQLFSGKEVFEQEAELLPVIGVRYTLPFFIESDLRINSQGRVRLALEGEQWLLPRLFFNWQANTDWEYHLDLQYMLGKKWSLSGGYDSRYRWGGGLLWRF
ncbi:multicopper oxidase domain-containing protein [Chitinophaga nivalis]|uniref:Multicopper oxidase domain-containing protein n=1 Tax=Chitinophaga nivalis TaxID=2991709 RepID=A0ABT3ILF9_9BACT|nr:multicopper oxidase domain-containing protein [Chitinophaga nivalis]MCW3465725.1 multicopper oxidase domain-containing protein [Chitinophaga nivalis]MCW3484584.1 multicopper oxidase domain-containing protein [Chitinophaga nivalis]